MRIMKIMKKVKIKKIMKTKKKMKIVIKQQKKKFQLKMIKKKITSLIMNFHQLKPKLNISTKNKKKKI